MEDWQNEVAKELAKLAGESSTPICRRDVYRLVSLMVDLLYPSRCEEGLRTQALWNELTQKTVTACTNLLTQVEAMGLPQTPAELSRAFAKQWPAIKAKLDQDAAFFSSQDPACESLLEVVLCYPGFFALAVYRLAHALYQLKVPLLPRLLSEHAHEKTGIDIHPGARLDCPIFIDHGTGIVIGETSVIGHHVKIFQGVTLGAPVVTAAMRGKQRHPMIGNHVVLYANATILGGKTKIGDRAIIGGNAWIVDSVAADAKIYHNP